MDEKYPFTESFRNQKPPKQQWSLVIPQGKSSVSFAILRLPKRGRKLLHVCKDRCQTFVRGERASDEGLPARKTDWTTAERHHQIP